MDLFCLDGWVLANSVDLDQTLQETAFGQGPRCLLIIWDVKCLQNRTEHKFYLKMTPQATKENTENNSYCNKADIQRHLWKTK